MIYDWRGRMTQAAKDMPPCRSFDARTGESVSPLFYYDTETHRVGRYAVDERGRLEFVPGVGLKTIWETREIRFEPISVCREAIGA